MLNWTQSMTLWCIHPTHLLTAMMGTSFDVPNSYRRRKRSCADRVLSKICMAHLSCIRKGLPTLSSESSFLCLCKCSLRTYTHNCVIRIVTCCPVSGKWLNGTVSQLVAKSYDKLVWESLPTNMSYGEVYCWYCCYLDIVEGILVHGVGRSLSVQFEHNHPTVMPYTMGQTVQMNERISLLKNPWRYVHLWCFNW